MCWRVALYGSLEGFEGQNWLKHPVDPNILYPVLFSNPRSSTQSIESRTHNQTVLTPVGGINPFYLNERLLNYSTLANGSLHKLSTHANVVFLSSETATASESMFLPRVRDSRPSGR